MVFNWSNKHRLNRLFPHVCVCVCVTPQRQLCVCASSGPVNLRSLVIELQNFNCICAASCCCFFSGVFSKIVCFVGFKPFSLWCLIAHRRFWFFACLLYMYFRFARLDSIQDKEKKSNRNTSADINIVACSIAYGVHCVLSEPKLWMQFVYSRVQTIFLSILFLRDVKFI